MFTLLDQKSPKLPLDLTVAIYMYMYVYVYMYTRIIHVLIVLNVCLFVDASVTMLYNYLLPNNECSSVVSIN